MSKRITKSLKQAIVRAIYTGNEQHCQPMRPSEIVGYIQNDSKLPISMRGKTTKQVAYILSQLARDYDDVIITEILGRNGTNHHGNERFTKAFSIKSDYTLSDAEKAVGVPQKQRQNKQQITVMLSPDSVKYIQAWKKLGMSAGQVVENLITADREINGSPKKQTDGSFTTFENPMKINGKVATSDSRKSE